ncbi:hypothetical protein D3C76_1530900 [compost metagenome]
MRAIAMGDDQLVAGMNLGDLLGGDPDVGALVVRGHGFTPAEQGVTAQSNDDTHGACPSKQRVCKQRGLPVGIGPVWERACSRMRFIRKQ